MHGRECEERKRARHMCSVPPVAAATLIYSPSTADSSAPPSSPLKPDSFSKEGRKISVGDCALFQSGNSQPFIGIIRSLTSNKENCLRLAVNWLYRPADVKLSKGISLEAAPNEVFYSFHKDEISAASLLHPCKVAFLRKGVELISGISSFVCRRVYDIQNKCLWWLTDQDYINEHQEEVDKLLDRTRSEMHAAVQSGARSPKALNGTTSIQQSKPSSEALQNSTTSYPSQGKGKKRERSDRCLEPIKRERPSRTDVGDSGSYRLESFTKAEIAEITEKGELINFEGVDKLVHLMHLDRSDKKIDLAGRTLLTDVIAATDKPECLDRFVQLMGVPVLHDWLQEAHKGRVGDCSSPKENDKCIEEFLLALLRALNKLPVNLHALQTSNIGKSVNNLRSHKNLEIQKKARTLVDTWKKRVEMEMKINDSKSTSNQSVSWTGKPGFSEVSHGGNKRAGSSEVAIKSVVALPSGSKTSSIKIGNNDFGTKSTVASPGTTKLGSAVPVSTTILSKDLHCKMPTSSGTSDMPLTTIREEKSSSSSQSQNNSQSCSSDHAKNACKEDARSSTSGSMKAKTSSGSSRTRKSSNGFLSTVQKESILGKPGFLNRNITHDKISHVGPTCERSIDNPADCGNSHKLIVRLPNPGRSPARSASGGSIDDSSLVNRAASPGVSDKNDHSDRKARGLGDSCRSDIPAGLNTESWQGNDMKSGLSGSVEVDRSPPAVSDEERVKSNFENAKLNYMPKSTCLSPGNDKRDLPKYGKSHAAAFSMTALVESCVKYSEANSLLSVGDDGMNLLASVASGEISKSQHVSPSGSPEMNSPGQENPNCIKSSRDDALAHGHALLDDKADGDPQKQIKDTGSLLYMGAVEINTNETRNVSDERKGMLPVLEDKTACKRGEEFPHSSIDSKQTTDPCSRFGADPTAADGVVMSAVSPDTQTPFRDLKEEILEADGTSKPCEKSTICVNGEIIDDFKANDLSEGDQKVVVEKDAVEEPSSCLIDDKRMDIQMNMPGRTATSKKLPPIEMNHYGAVGQNEDVVPPCTIATQGITEESKPEKTDCSDAKVQLNPNDAERLDKTMPEMMKVNANDDKLERKEALEHFSKRSAPQEESTSIPAHEADQCKKSTGSKLSDIEADEMEECQSTAEASSLPNAAGSDLSTKLDFDLNEGFPADEGNQPDPAISVASGCTSAGQLSSLLLCPTSPFSSSLPSSITVAAAAKGPFVHAENLLKCKVELGWKGSASTSAFRPAEPRKVLEMSLGVSDVTSCDTAPGKHDRPTLDFDLNVPDGRVLEDVISLSSVHDSRMGSRTAINSHDIGCTVMFNSTVQCTGGLDLDLNRVDEGADIGQSSASRSKKTELLPVRPSSSGAFSDGEANALRDFDLNDGPGDEAGAELAKRNQLNKSSGLSSSYVACLRINNSESASHSSWFPPVSPYTPVTIPSLLQDRGDQAYPFVANTGAHSILGSAGGTFGADPYRGPMLSSSAMTYSPAPFQYAPYPFSNSYSLASTSFPGGSTAFLDSSSGEAHCFPAVPSQLMGPANFPSSHYPRPYAISLPETTAGGGGADSSRKWGKQSLDLNSGPGSTDMVARDDRVSSIGAQVTVGIAEEHSRIYHSTGGSVKRKEPGGCEADRFTNNLHGSNRFRL